jgi:outer membrane protein insertion porin family
MSKPVVPTRRRRRMPIAAALTVAALMLIPSAGNASETAAQVISVEGNHRIDADTVRSYFHAAADGSFDAASLDAALKALIATGLFEHVEIGHAGERLVVHLTEAKVLDRVAFEGNKKIKDKELEAIVQSKPRGTLQRAVIQADVGRIMEAYRHAGRDDVGVVPEIIDRGHDRVDLVYEVTEGSKTTVRQINFVGNRVFSKRQLAAVIKTSATNMLSFLTGGDAYDPDRVAADRELLRLYYRGKGYADASVPSAVAEYDPAAKGFALTFSIDEGPLYHFGDVRVDCHIAGLDPGQLRRLLLIRTGAVFDGNALDKSTEIVGTELAKLGYPFAQATTRTTRDTDARRVGVALVIDQGPAPMSSASKSTATREPATM